MAQMDKPLTCRLEGHAIVINDDLHITFERTIRVPDNQQTSYLPPDLGTFPLKPVSKFTSKLCPSMAAKGGVFFPMYRKSSSVNSLLHSN